MAGDESAVINYANHGYSFMKYQEQHKNLCQTISKAKRRDMAKSLKRANSYFYEYKTYIKSREVDVYLSGYLRKLADELHKDVEFNKLCQSRDKSITEKIIFNQKYYVYLIKVLRFIGKFGDELSRTFMPNKSGGIKMLKYYNNNSFFDKFTVYKSNTSDELSEYNVRQFRKGFSSLIGFYFAYYLFIDERSRYLCEEVFSNVLAIVLSPSVLKIIEIKSSELNSTEVEKLRILDYETHNALNNIFYRCTYSFSEYGVLPRVEKKILVDRTAM